MKHWWVNTLSAGDFIQRISVIVGVETRTSCSLVTKQLFLSANFIDNKAFLNPNHASEL